MTEKLAKLIVKIVEKKKGIKLADMVKYLEGKASEIEGLGEVDFATVKGIAVQLFANKRIDLIEYKLMGEGEKNRVFCIPAGASVTYTEEDDLDLEQPTLPEPVVEIKTVLPADLFEGYVVISDNNAEFVAEADQAQADYMASAGRGEHPRLYGAVPIQLKVTAVLDSLREFPSIQVEEVTTFSDQPLTSGSSSGTNGDQPRVSGSVGAPEGPVTTA